MHHLVGKWILKLCEALGIPQWVFWAVVGPVALIGYGLMLRDWFHFLGELRRTTASFGGRGLIGAFFFRPGVRCAVNGVDTRIWHNGWLNRTRLELRVAAAGRIWVRSGSFSHRELNRFRGELVQTEDPHFESSFSVLAAPARFAVELLDTDVRHHLETFATIAYASQSRRLEGEFSMTRPQVPTVEILIDREGLRIRFDGQPSGAEIERMIRSAGQVARRAQEISRT